MPDKETARVEAFSDGVFAIALTLLVLDFKVPHVPAEAVGGTWHLFGALLTLWPTLVAFVLSFGTVLIMWVNHHGLFRHAHRVDSRLLFANGLLLLLVTFVPFSTAVLADYLNHPAANAAAVFYCGTFVLINVGYNLLLKAVVASRHPTPAPAADAAIRRVRRAYRVAFVAYLLATAVAVFSAFAGLAVCLSLWALWAGLDYVPRLSAGRHEGRSDAAAKEEHL